MTGSFQSETVASTANIRDNILNYRQANWEIPTVIVTASSGTSVNVIVFAVHGSEEEPDPNGGTNESWR